MTRGWRYAQLSRVLLLLGAAAIASPAAAQSLYSGAPPWAVDAPGAAGSRFALGLITFGERQESLRIAAFDQLVEVEDLRSGRVETSRLPGDPALLDRKFDLRFEQKSVGSSFAVALPSAGVFGAGQLYPSLTFHAAEADVSLDFGDVKEPGDSTSLRGQGPLIATTFDVVTTSCSQCPWFAATGVRFEKLPSLTVERSPRFGLQGFAVSRDDVRLEREVGEVSSRVGYVAPSGRAASFVGVQHHWTDLDIDDRLAYRSSLTETRLSSRTKLESETTLAVAGVDWALGPRLFSRLETAVGGGDVVVRLNFAYLLVARKHPIDGEAEVRRRASEIAADIVEPLRGLEAVLDDRAACLRAGTCTTERFLNETENRLLEILSARELAGLRDWVRERFRAVRSDAQIAAGRTSGFHPVALDPGWQWIVARVLEIVGKPRRMAEDKDMLTDLCVTSAPPGAEFLYWPASDTDDSDGTTTNGRLPVFRGIFAYRLSKGDLSYECSKACPRLNLVDNSQPTLKCDLKARSCTREDLVPKDCRVQR